MQEALVRTTIQLLAAALVMIPDALTATIRSHALRVLFLMDALLAPMALVARPAPPPPNFRHTTWTARDGAQTDLNAMAQTSDGSLWLGGVNGLFRFDALHFEEIDLPRHPELRSADVYSLLATPDGGLWIGYDLRGAAFLKDGEVTVYSVSDGLPAGTVRSMGRQRDGTIWAATSDGLARFRRGHWETMDKSWQHLDVIRSLFVDGDDTVWVTAASGVYSKRTSSDVFLKVPQPFHGAGVLAQSPTGAIWAYDEDSIRVVGHAAALLAGTRQPGTGIVFDTNGFMWLVADDPRGGGLLRIPATTLTENHRPVIATDTLAPIDNVTLRAPNMELADDEGDIWIIGEGGLERVSAGNFLSLKRIPHYPARGRHSIAPGDDGTLWIGNALRVTPTSPPGLVSYREGQFEATASIHDVSCIIRAEGAVWIGDRSALWKKKGDQLTRFDLPWHADFARFQSMAGDGNGGLWASVLHKGMYRFVDGVWTAYPRLLMPLVVATDWSAHLWLGYSDGRVAMFDGSNVTWFSTTEGLDIGAVTAIEARHGHVWVGGNSGMARLDGHRFTALNFDPDVAPRKVKGIVERFNGDLWLLGAMGIERVSAEEIGVALTHPAHALLARLLDAGDGLEGSSGIRPVPALIEGTDGMLWATTSSDIYRIDPEHLTRDAPPPRLVLRDFIADGHTYRIDRPATLPPHVSNLRIAYAGLSLNAAEKIRYRYRLDGFDKTWQEVDTRREAFFTNLPPGSYRFRVQAHLVGEGWNATESDLAFTIKPAFTQTRSFFVLCALVVAGIFWLLIGLRVWQVRRRLHLLFEARAAEREHIARDLHDTLLQSSQGLILKVHAASRRMSADNPDRARLDAAVTNADLTLVEGRDRINELRNAGRTTARLRSDLIAIGQSAADETGTNFAQAGNEALPELHADIVDEVFSIGREALLNAFRHAKAQHVMLELTNTRSGFVLSVIDDGRGMGDDALARATIMGHWGVAGMRERAARIRGSLKFSNRPNNGMEVVLTIPAKVAYRRNGPWLWRT